MANPDTNRESGSTTDVQPKLQAVMSPEQQLKSKISANINELRVYWSPAEVKELEGDIQQIGALLDNRIKRKREIVASLRQGKKPPMDFNPADSTIRQKYQSFELHAAKYLTVGGFTPAYRELMKNLDSYIDVKRKEIKAVDATIKDIKAEKGKRGQDKAKEDEIRRMLNEKKAA